MPEIKLTASVEIATRFAKAINYQETIKNEAGEDIPNPVSALTTIKQWLIGVAKNQILATEANTVSQTAVADKMKEVIDIT